MATIFQTLGTWTQYKDNRYEGTLDDLLEDLKNSLTVYVGNLSFFSTEEQIHEIFSKCGPVRRIIMGLNRNNRTPCGFCFVEYYDRQSVIDCLRYIDRTKLDERPIRIDLDYGYTEQRNCGRGILGGQVREDYKKGLELDRETSYMSRKLGYRYDDKRGMKRSRDAFGSSAGDSKFRKLDGSE